jgi:hypothetical protein
MSDKLGFDVRPVAARKLQQNERSDGKWQALLRWICLPVLTPAI